MGLAEDTTELEVDREVGVMLESEPDAFRQWFGIDTDRALFGSGRRLVVLQRRMADLNAQEAAMAGEFHAARVRLVTQIATIEAAIESVALARREEGRGNSLLLPGVGTWSTRNIPGKWSVEDEATVIAALNGVEREAYLKPQPDKLDARALLADLPAVMAARGGEVLPGLKKGDDRIGVSASYEALR